MIGAAQIFFYVLTPRGSGDLGHGLPFFIYFRGLSGLYNSIVGFAVLSFSLEDFVDERIAFRSGGGARGGTAHLQHVAAPQQYHAVNTMPGEKEPFIQRV